MSTVILVAIPRYLFRFKDRLSAYSNYLVRCREELINRGKDVDKLMRGLDKPMQDLEGFLDLFQIVEST